MDLRSHYTKSNILVLVIGLILGLTNCVDESEIENNLVPILYEEQQVGKPEILGWIYDKTDLIIDWSIPMNAIYYSVFLSEESPYNFKLVAEGVVNSSIKIEDIEINTYYLYVTAFGRYSDQGVNSDTIWINIKEYPQ